MRYGLDTPGFSNANNEWHATIRQLDQIWLEGDPHAVIDRLRGLLDTLDRHAMADPTIQARITRLGRESAVAAATCTHRTVNAVGEEIMVITPYGTGPAPNVVDDAEKRAIAAQKKFDAEREKRTPKLDMAIIG